MAGTKASLLEAARSGSAVPFGGLNPAQVWLLLHVYYVYCVFLLISYVYILLILYILYVFRMLYGLLECIFICMDCLSVSFFFLLCCMDYLSVSLKRKDVVLIFLMLYGLLECMCIIILYIYCLLCLSSHIMCINYIFLCCRDYLSL